MIIFGARVGNFMVESKKIFEKVCVDDENNEDDDDIARTIGRAAYA